MLRITLPLVLPGVLGAAVFVFAEMLGSFSAALVLGLPNRFYVVTTAMYQLVSQYPPRFPTAAAMGVSLFAVMFAMVWLYRRIVSAGSYVTITGKAFRPRVMDVGRLRWLLLSYLPVFRPLGLRTISGVILPIDRSLEESAQMCGATWGHRLRTVTMPLLKPGLVAAWLLLFIASVRELGASILLMGPKAKVITPAIVESWFSTSTELTAAMALLQTLAVAAALAILFTVARRAVQPAGE